MKTKFVFALAVAPIWLATSSCAPKASLSASDSRPIPVSASDGEASNLLFDQVNSYRKSVGKPPLHRNPNLDKLARSHAEFMRRNRGKFKVYGTNVSHDGFEARTVIARQQYGMSTFHENVAAAPKGTSLLKSWVDSHPHELAIRSTWSDSGIAVVKDSDGTMFATQVFGMKSLPHTTLQDRWNSF